MVFLGFPMVGLAGLFWFFRRMKTSRIPSPPTRFYTLLFVNLVAWLHVLYTFYFWEPSGLFDLEIIYVGYVSPLLAIWAVIVLRRDRRLSRYHFGAFVASIGYFVVWAVGVAASTHAASIHKSN